MWQVPLPVPAVAVAALGGGGGGVWAWGLADFYFITVSRSGWGIHMLMGLHFDTKYLIQWNWGTLIDLCDRGLLIL